MSKSTKSKVNAALARQHFKAFMQACGLNPEDNSHLHDTPHRFTQMICDATKNYGRPPRLTTEADYDAAKELKVTLFEAKTDELVVVRDIEFSSICFDARTPVRTPGGLVPIREIKKGDQVVTLNAAGELEVRKVAESSTRKVSELLELSFSNGRKLRCTKEHPFYSIGAGWTEAQNLKVGAALYSLRNSRGFARSETRKTLRVTQGYSLGYFLGAFCSDGWTSRNVIGIGVKSEAFIKRYCLEAEAAFGVPFTYRKVKAASGFIGESYQFLSRKCSGQLVSLVRSLTNGKTKKTKTFTLPRVALSSFDCFRGFVQGYVDGDGSYWEKADKRYARIFSSNLSFLEELRSIFNTQLSKNSTAGNYILEVPIGLVAKAKRQRPLSLVKARLAYEEVVMDLNREQVHLVGVRALSQTGKKPYTVCNFSVEGNPTYLAGDIWVHNCAHHFAPFFGKCHIGYIPDGSILGLSKFARITDHFCLRPQTQEILTEEIAACIRELTGARFVGVMMEAQHTCMSCRGPRKLHSSTVTSKFMPTGQETTKSEFLRLVLRQ